MQYKKSKKFLLLIAGALSTLIPYTSLDIPKNISQLISAEKVNAELYTANARNRRIIKNLPYQDSERPRADYPIRETSDLAIRVGEMVENANNAFRAMEDFADKISGSNLDGALAIAESARVLGAKSRN